MIHKKALKMLYFGFRIIVAVFVVPAASRFKGFNLNSGIILG